MRHPTISGFDALKVLINKKGFKVRRRKGSHVVVSKNGIAPFTVPLHPELKRGTLNHIIKCSGNFKKEFFELLRD